MLVSNVTRVGFLPFTCWLFTVQQLCGNTSGFARFNYADLLILHNVLLAATLFWTFYGHLVFNELSLFGDNLDCNKENNKLVQGRQGIERTGGYRIVAPRLLRNLHDYPGSTEVLRIRWKELSDYQHSCLRRECWVATGSLSVNQVLRSAARIWAWRRNVNPVKMKVCPGCNGYVSRDVCKLHFLWKWILNNHPLTPVSYSPDDIAVLYLWHCSQVVLPLHCHLMYSLKLMGISIPGELSNFLVTVFGNDGSKNIFLFCSSSGGGGWVQGEQAHLQQFWFFENLGKISENVGKIRA